jgi:hypothetical protein
VTYENNNLALQSILAEWSSPRSYADRVANLRGAGTGTRNNGDYFLTAATVLDDNDADQLKGSAGQDWFWAKVGQDSLSDRLTTEFIN